MGFPNTMYKPGDRVWMLDWLDRPWEYTVYAVRWTETEISYELDGRTGQWDCDDLYDTKEAAIAAGKEAEDDR